MYRRRQANCTPKTGLPLAGPASSSLTHLFSLSWGKGRKEHYCLEQRVPDNGLRGPGNTSQKVPVSIAQRGWNSVGHKICPLLSHTHSFPHNGRVRQLCSGLTHGSALKVNSWQAWGMIRDSEGTNPGLLQSLEFYSILFVQVLALGNAS